MNLLFVPASPTGANSASRQIANELIFKLKNQNPNLKTIVRDLTSNPPPHWGVTELEASFTPRGSRSNEHQKALRLSDELCSELVAAEILVVATPMWNFSVPSTLKAWIDHIVRVGVTFEYTAQGPRGLLDPNKELFIVESAGGNYLTEPHSGLNHTAPYLTSLFQFLGVQKISSITAHGTAINRDVALSSARTQLDLVLSPERNVRI